MRIGKRTAKTGLSVFICIILSFLFNRETYVISALTAIFTLREDIRSTIMFGRHRVGGNVVGAISSLLIISIFDLFGKTPLIQLLFIPLVIMLLIALLAALGFEEGTVGACATLLTILFMIPESHSYVYAWNRVIDSFIGMFVALGVNYVFPYTPPQQTAIEE